MAVKRNIPQPAIDRTPKAKAPRTALNEIRREGTKNAIRGAQGIGESKRFGGGGEDKDLSGCTVNGEPLPRECWDTFPYSLTDQGKADAAKIQSELAQQLPSVYSRNRTEYEDILDPDKQIKKYRDDLSGQNGILEEISDPMKKAMERYTPRGHRGLFMGQKKCADSGMIRGGLEYVPVLIPDPDNPGMKTRVVIGGMFLASVSEEAWQNEQRRVRAINEARQVTALEKVQESADQVMSSSGMIDLARRKRTIDDLAGIQIDDGEQADTELLAHESA